MPFAEINPRRSTTTVGQGGCGATRRWREASRPSREASRPAVHRTPAIRSVATSPTWVVFAQSIRPVTALRTYRAMA